MESAATAAHPGTEEDRVVIWNFCLTGGHMLALTGFQEMPFRICPSAWNFWWWVDILRGV
jgi:hypothetical protein